MLVEILWNYLVDILWKDLADILMKDVVEILWKYLAEVFKNSNLVLCAPACFGESPLGNPSRGGGVILLY